MKKDRKTTRLKEYDYSQAGAYFVTICTRDRKCFLGRIVNGKMHLYTVGDTVNASCKAIPQHFRNVTLDACIIMPNHVHGIIMINEIVGTDYNLSLQLKPQKEPAQNRYQQVVPKSLSYIIATFKSAVSRQVGKTETKRDFAWQARFYEHIIRDDNELSRIREYIQNNPLNWQLDRDNLLSSNFNMKHSLYWKEIYAAK
jgi:REP element-mobilizing transposase RayT